MPPPRKTEHEREIIDRLRRMETRLTRYLDQNGFDIRTGKPKFEKGRLTIPSPQSSLKECLDAVPKDWAQPVDVYVGDDYLTTLD